MIGLADSQWGLQEQLLAAIADVLAWTAWSRTKDAQHNRNRPKPIQRPGVGAPEGSEHYGSGAMTIEEIDQWLGWATPLDPPAVTEPKQPRDALGRFTKPPEGGGHDGR